LNRTAPRSSNPGIYDVEMRLRALEAESEIRSLVARYMEICDGLNPNTSFSEVGQLFTRDAVWLGDGKAYDEAFGGHRGREAIADFLRSYAQPPHFAANTHFLTSESLTVVDDTAEGRWVMLQTPTFASGDSFLLAARLELEFEMEEGRWRIGRFVTTNLFKRPIEKGWHSDAPIPVPKQQTQPRSD